MVISHPPPIQDFQITHKTVLRYTVGTLLAALSVTFQNLLDTVLFNTTAIAPFDLFRMVKIRAVEMWALPTIGSASTVSITFAGIGAGIVGDERFHSDTSMGIEPAHLRVKPDSKSLASNFQVSGPNNAFTIWAPVGAVIDLHLSFRSSVNGAAVAAQNASLGAIVGSLAFRGFDGVALATTSTLLPTGVIQV